MKTFSTARAANDDVDYIRAHPLMTLTSITGEITATYLPANGLCAVHRADMPGKLIGGTVEFWAFREQLLIVAGHEFNPGDINRWTEAVTAAIAAEQGA